MELWQLRQLQSLPLEVKEIRSNRKIEEFVEHYGGWQYCYGSISGGLDSGVLAHMLRKKYPGMKFISVKAIECKENQAILDLYENIDFVQPLKSKIQVIKEFGYPVGSKKISKAIYSLRHPTEDNEASRKLYLTGIKRDGTKSKWFKLAKRWLPLINAPFEVSNKCCYYMKEEPLERYAKEYGLHPFIGERAEEGDTRRGSYLQTGCNNFSERNGISKPLGFWTRQDILEYTLKYNLPVSKAYGEIIMLTNGKLTTTKAGRTGCDICLFGIHMEKRPHRFDRMQIEEPEKYDFWVNKMGFGEVMDYINVKYGMGTWQIRWADTMEIKEQIGGIA